MGALLRLLMGLILAAALAESLLHAFPVSTGYSLMGVSTDYPVLRGAPHARYVYSKNWNFRLANAGELNNFGFRASYDYRPDSRNWLVVGNSFVTADALVPRLNMTEQLSQTLGRPLYAIGMDGSTLVDYLAAARWGARTFWAGSSADQPLVLVLLTTGDLDRSCTPRGGQHYLQLDADRVSIRLVPRPAPSIWVGIANHSMLFRYVFDNLRIASNWKRQSLEEEEPASPVIGAPAPHRAWCAAPQSSVRARSFLLNAFHQLETDYGAHVIFALAPGYRAEQSYQPWAIRDVDVFADQAAQDGFRVIRLEAAFRSALGAGSRLDFMPEDGHWNASGNALAAQTVAGVLQGYSGLNARLGVQTDQRR